MSIFGFYPKLKLSFQHNIVLKNLLSSARFFWDARLSSREMDRNFKFGGTIGSETRTWSSYFLISKYLNYTQFYLMVLEQCERIEPKVQATYT